MGNFVMLPLKIDLCHISFLLKCKFLEIQFNQNSQPDGGKIYTFLLEKVSQLYNFFKALFLLSFYNWFVFALAFHHYALWLV